MNLGLQCFEVGIVLLQPLLLSDTAHEYIALRTEYSDYT